MMDKMLIPMLLIRANGGTINGRTRFQKLVFLFQNEAPELREPFHYIAWDYGPYSKELQEELNDLVDLELLEERPVNLDSEKVIYQYVLTRDGRDYLRAALGDPEAARIRDKMISLCKTWKDRSLDKLISFVYAEHPEYAVRSRLLS